MTDRRPVYRGRVVDLGIETVHLPDGRSFPLEVVRHPGGAAVLAVDERRRVYLLRQYRHAAGGWLWEVPAGRLEPGERPEAAARRELAEEAGIEARDWTPLGGILTTPGFCDEVIHLFLARGLEFGPAHTEQHELIEVHPTDLGEALARARDGRIRDAKTVAVLLRAAARLGE